MRKYNNENMDACCREAKFFEQIKKRRSRFMSGLALVYTIILWFLLFEKMYFLEKPVLDGDDILDFMVNGVLLIGICTWEVNSWVIVENRYKSPKMATNLQYRIPKLPCDISRLWYFIRKKVLIKMSVLIVILEGTIVWGMFAMPDWEVEGIGFIPAGVQLIVPDALGESLKFCIFAILYMMICVLVGLKIAEKIIMYNYWRYRREGKGRVLL